jgi:hypothetical protein
MLLKIRLHAAGNLTIYYHVNLGTSFDGRCCRFLDVEYGLLRKRVLAGGTEDEILAWCFEQGKRPNEEQVLVWNKFMLKRGCAMEDEGSAQELERHKHRVAWRTAATPSHSTITTEVDEGRKP